MDKFVIYSKLLNIRISSELAVYVLLSLGLLTMTHYLLLTGSVKYRQADTIKNFHGIMAYPTLLFIIIFNGWAYSVNSENTILFFCLGTFLAVGQYFFLLAACGHAPTPVDLFFSIFFIIINYFMIINVLIDGKIIKYSVSQFILAPLDKDNLVLIASYYILFSLSFLYFYWIIKFRTETFFYLFFIKICLKYSKFSNLTIIVLNFLLITTASIHVITYLAIDIFYIASYKPNFYRETFIVVHTIYIGIVCLFIAINSRREYFQRFRQLLFSLCIQAIGFCFILIGYCYLIAFLVEKKIHPISDLFLFLKKTSL